MIEVKAPFRFHAVDCKQILNRSYTGVESKLFEGIRNVQSYNSRTGFPYGRYITMLQPGETCRVTLPGNAFAVAWADAPGSGVLTVKVDGKKVFSAAADKPFVLLDKSRIFMENRKGIQGLAYGMHTLEFSAEKSPVRLMGVFSYDLRSNRSAERVLRGVSGGGEVTFEPAFKAVPLIRCYGGLKLEKLSAGAAVFSGSGSFEAIGE